MNFSDDERSDVTERSGRKPATLAHVAAAVGLSPAAVSLALRGKPGVSEATRERVAEAARTLGYRPVGGATRQHQKPVTIGLVIKAVRGDAPEANRFYAPVMAGIEEACRLHRFDLMLATMPVDEHYYPIEVPRLVTDSTCDGLIVAGAHLASATAAILRDAPPVVLVDAYCEDETFDSVSTDNVGGARTAVEYLLARGHRDIAMLGAEAGAFPSVVQRRRGYEQVIGEAGLRLHFVDSPYYPPEGAAAAGVAFLTANRDVTAVVCANDAVAVALVQAAHAAGIAVPQDVSVVGFDDIDLTAFVSPPLTTMAVDKVGMGRIAVSMLAHRLQLGQHGVVQTLLRPQLVERESVAARRQPAREPAGSLR